MRPGRRTVTVPCAHVGARFEQQLELNRTVAILRHIEERRGVETVLGPGVNIRSRLQEKRNRGWAGVDRGV